MSREYKFRGRKYDSRMWIYGSLVICENGDHVIEYDRKKYGYVGIGIKVDPETVGQYTGLRDKNGNEIYQGDIIRCPKYYETPENSYNPIEIAGKVVFEEGCWRLSEGGCLYDEHVSYGGEVEVIGNIYENPELVNKR